MKKEIVKLEKVSQYWWSDDVEYMNWQFTWKGEAAKRAVVDRQRKFLKEYVAITHKYGILHPGVDFIPGFLANQDTVNYLLSEANMARFPGHMPFHALYDLSLVQDMNTDSVGYVYPSTLFIDNEGGNIERRVLIDIFNLHTVDDLRNASYEPVKIGYSSLEDYMSINVKTSSDCFFPVLFPWNRKVLDASKDRPYLRNKMIDNSHLAYLNAPRFNSFLRALKQLCLSYGAEFSFENIMDENIEKPYWINEDGILTSAEIVYYEDVVDILDDICKI